jgi:hypothetical protein
MWPLTPHSEIGGASRSTVIADSASKNIRARGARPRHVLPRLQPFYYLENFEWVLSTIFKRYADLLSAEESRFIADFGEVPRPFRALLTRMVMRQGDLFKDSKLNYVEIGDTRAAVQPNCFPGDRVQDNQRRLLEYCVLHEMPVAVCYTRWTT